MNKYIALYAATIIPPAIYTPSSTINSGECSPLTIDFNTTQSRIKRVFGIPKAQFVKDVRYFHNKLEHIPNTIIDLVPMPADASNLRLREGKTDFQKRTIVKLEPNPHSFTVSKAKDLNFIIEQKLLPTLHFLQRAIGFSSYPGIHSKRPRRVGKVVEWRDMLDVMQQEREYWHYGWNPVKLCDAKMWDGTRTLDSFLWCPHGHLEFEIELPKVPTGTEKNVLAVFCPPWILTPAIFDKLARPKLVGKSNLRQAEDGLSVTPTEADEIEIKIDSILHHITEFCAKTHTRHFILSNYNEYSFGTYDYTTADRATFTDWSSVLLTHPMPYYSCPLNYRSQQTLRFPPKDKQSMANMPSAFEVGCLEALMYWIHRGMSCPQSELHDKPETEVVVEAVPEEVVHRDAADVFGTVRANGKGKKRALDVEEEDQVKRVKRARSEELVPTFKSKAVGLSDFKKLLEEDRKRSTLRRHGLLPQLAPEPKSTVPQPTTAVPQPKVAAPQAEAGPSSPKKRGRDEDEHEASPSKKTKLTIETSAKPSTSNGRRYHAPHPPPKPIAPLGKSGLTSMLLNSNVDGKRRRVALVPKSISIEEERENAMCQRGESPGCVPPFDSEEDLEEARANAPHLNDPSSKGSDFSKPFSDLFSIRRG